MASLRVMLIGFSEYVVIDTVLAAVSTGDITTIASRPKSAKPAFRESGFSEE